MAVKKTIGISILAILLGGVAVPVHGGIKLATFFNPSDKYRQWFHETTWQQDARAGLLIRASGDNSTAARYPYPDKKFVMTVALWNKSSGAILDGQSDWFDSEIVRQRAGVNRHPPAMDFLAWMYQEGRGLEQDLRKAFMWYERAKMAGMKNLSGSSDKIFEQLSGRDKRLAELQLAEDTERLNSGARKGIARKSGYRAFDRVNLRVMKKQRDPGYFKRKHRVKKLK